MFIWQKPKLQLQQIFKIEAHNDEVNKIALSSNDDKRLQIFDGFKTYSMEQMLLKYVQVRW